MESSSSQHSSKLKRKSKNPKSKSSIANTSKTQERKPHKKYCWKLKNKYYVECTEVSVFTKQLCQK